MIHLVALVFALIATGAQAATLDPLQDARIDRIENAIIPLDLIVRDEMGYTTTLAELGRDRPIVFVPVQHKCPNLCGITLSGLMQAIREQSLKPGRDFVIIAFGIDPREGPAEAQTSLDELHAAYPESVGTDIHAVTASAQTIKTATSGLGYRYAWDERIGQYAHLAAIAVLTPAGRLSRWIYGISPDPAELDLAIGAAASNSLSDWREQILTLCYHFNPLKGPYSAAIWSALRIAAGSTALLLVFALVYLHARRRNRNGGDGS
jgi:protein SCO1/2